MQTIEQPSTRSMTALSKTEKKAFWQEVDRLFNLDDEPTILQAIDQIAQKYKVSRPDIHQAIKTIGRMSCLE